MRLTAVHSTEFIFQRKSVIIFTGAIALILLFFLLIIRDNKKIKLSREEQRELQYLWDQAMKLKYNDYEKQVLPKWQKYGDKAVLFALEKLKSSTFPARLQSSDEGDLRGVVRDRIFDVPDWTYRPILQQLRDKTVSAYYIGSLMGYLKGHLNYEVCSTLVNEFAHDKRMTKHRHDQYLVPRVCDWACFLVIDKLDLNRKFPESNASYSENDKSIKAFKKWWKENREYAKKKLKEIEASRFIRPEEDSKHYIEDKPWPPPPPPPMP